MPTFPLVLPLLLSLAFAGQAKATDVWHWQDCPKPTMVRVTVEANRTRIAETAIPVCSLDRARFAVDKEQRTFDFPANLAAGPLGKKGAAHVTGSIWEAGSETHGLVLGVSFQTDDEILLNSFHVASMSKASSSEVAPGVIVRSSVEQPQRGDGR